MDVFHSKPRCHHHRCCHDTVLATWTHPVRSSFYRYVMPLLKIITLRYLLMISSIQVQTVSLLVICLFVLFKSWYALFGHIPVLWGCASTSHEWVIKSQLTACRIFEDKWLSVMDKWLEFFFLIQRFICYHPPVTFFQMLCDKFYSLNVLCIRRLAGSSCRNKKNTSSISCKKKKKRGDKHHRCVVLQYTLTKWMRLEAFWSSLIVLWHEGIMFHLSCAWFCLHVCGFLLVHQNLTVSWEQTKTIWASMS